MEQVSYHVESVWVKKPVNTDLMDSIVKEFMLNHITAQVLVAKGFKSLDEVHDYLYTQLPQLHPPELFKDMNKAIHRIMQAISRKEYILIYGDNDVDGITGAALLYEHLNKLGANVDLYITQPHAIKNSILLDVKEHAIEHNFQLIITVDCGITAVDQIKELTKENISVIITDHHQPTEEIPHCVATLNPRLINSEYPFKGLTGVGVAFKLAHGITNYCISKRYIDASFIDLKSYLDLVALGTVADMGPLVDENRILVRYGLRQLQKTKREGLIKLFKTCAIEIDSITASDISLKIAPRINSLGRISSPIYGAQLLLETDVKSGENLAKKLDLNNKKRQKIEQTMLTSLEEKLENDKSIFRNNAIVIASDQWHPGIVSLLTTRLSKQTNRPCCVISIENGLGKGSIRSIKTFPLLPSLKRMSNLFVSYGGHDFAAGITIKEENIETFKNQLIASANKELTPHDISHEVSIDAAVDFNEITLDLIDSLKLLEPYGQENPPPVFYAVVTQIWLPRIFGKKHMKLFLSQGEIILEGTAFNRAADRQKLMKKGLTLEIAYTPYLVTTDNNPRIQIQIKDFRIKQQVRKNRRVIY
ncbi:single-stranded-DNA-specific exonuclease RecJ [Chlamydiia bacterium]|nr:single-stranded-DNA-specific exonuclease RecJ [Chlamydiia bacterium]